MKDPTLEQSDGKCAFCQKDYTKRDMVRHLATCRKRTEATLPTQHIRSRKVYYLRAEDCWGDGFWVDLEIPGWATLEVLDEFLRENWLGCCDDHESEFYLDGMHTSEISKSDSIRVAFENMKVLHYSLDTLASCEINLVKASADVLSPDSQATLMARNNLTAIACCECCQPAVELCGVCYLPDDLRESVFCERHASPHRHEGDSFMLPMANSPRQGVCSNGILVEW